jgi:hypothetical protein
MRPILLYLRAPVESVVFAMALLLGVTAGLQPLWAQTAPPDPNCANGRLLCREVSNCSGGKFDSQGRCDGATFTIYYYYRGT